VNGQKSPWRTREVTRAVDRDQLMRVVHFLNSGFVSSEGGPYPLVARDRESRELWRGKRAIASRDFARGRMPRFDTPTREVASCERR
jgi:hypothetical protein